MDITDEILNTGIDIPQNWVWCRGYNIFNPLKTKKPSGRYFNYIDIESIDNKNQKVTSPKQILVVNAPSRASRGLVNGDTLFSMVRPYLKNIAYIDESLENCIASTGFYVCSPNKLLFSKYLFLMMTSPFIIGSLMVYMKGDNSPSINSGNIENQLFPVPPLNEQVCICEKLKDLLKIIKDKA